MKKIYSIVPAAMVMALVPQMMPAQTDLVLDNFATGAGKIDAVTGIHQATQTGAGIYGGTRMFQLNAGSNPYQQPVQVQVRPSSSPTDPSSFLWSVGYGVYARIDLIYGQTTALNLNLSGYDRLRVSFSGLSGGLNFNVVAWQASNNEASGCGINLAPSSNAFTVDFPLAKFPLNGAPLDWSNIETLDIIFQGGPNLAITGFTAIPTGSGEPMSPFVCGTPAAGLNKQ